jgi:methionyl-tRNA formyltransferase
VPTPSYNIIFAGTPEFAAVSLQALISSQHTVKAVYTQPDRPAGRGRKLTQSPVKETALQHDLPVYQPLTLRDEKEQKKLMAFDADIMIVAAYGLILPKAVLSLFPLGCLNVHASLLPRWRGAAPIQRAILAGDSETGITIMQMDVGLDTGAMLYKKSCSITAKDTAAMLHDKLATIGAEALLHTLNHLTEIKGETQDESQVTYAHKIKKEEGLLDFSLTASELVLKIRAFNSWPVAFFDDIRVWEAEVVERNVSHIAPGTILQASQQGIDVSTGNAVLRLLKLQLPGGRILPVSDIINSRKKDFAEGIVLGKKLT